MSNIDPLRMPVGLNITEPCEHCGGKGQLTTVDTILHQAGKDSIATFYVVACLSCGAQGSRGEYSPSGQARAVIGWNTRLFRKGGAA